MERETVSPHDELRRLRKAIGSQEKVAKLLETDQSTLSRLETGHIQMPEIPLALRIRRLLGIPVSAWDRRAA